MYDACLQKVTQTTEPVATQAVVMEKEPLTTVALESATEVSMRSNERRASSSGNKSSNKNRKRTKNRTKNQNGGNGNKNKVIKNINILQSYKY